MSYTVFIDDLSHYQEEEYREIAGRFDTAEEAIAKCQKIVEESLKSLVRPSQNAEQLWDLYMIYGDDPFIVGNDGAEPVEFSARGYALSYCGKLTQRRSNRSVALVVVCLAILIASFWMGWV